MAQLSIDVSDEFQQQFETMLQETARKVIAEIVSNPLERKEYLSKKEACQLIGISFNTLKQFEANGLKVIQVQNKQLISKKTIYEFLQAHES